MSERTDILYQGHVLLQCHIDEGVIGHGEAVQMDTLAALTQRQVAIETIGEEG